MTNDKYMKENSMNPIFEEQPLSKENPVKKFITTTTTQPMDVRNQKKEARKNRMRRSFVRKPPLGNTAAKSSIVKSDSVTQPKENIFTPNIEAGVTHARSNVPTRTFHRPLDSELTPETQKAKTPSFGLTEPKVAPQHISAGQGFKPGSGYIKDETTGDVASFDGKKFSLEDKSGNAISKPTSGFRLDDQPPQPAQIGQYAVTGMSAKDQTAFEGAIENTPETQANWDKQHQQWLSRNTTTPYVGPSLDGTTQPKSSPLENITQEDLDKMGWKERIAVINTLSKRDLGKSDIALGERDSSRKFAIDSSETASRNAERRFNIKGQKAELDKAQRMNDLKKAYLNTKDPSLKKRLEQQLAVLHGYTLPKEGLSPEQWFKADKAYREAYRDYLFDRDPKEGQNVPKYEDWIREYSPRGSELLYGKQIKQAPKAAIDHLRQNPHLAQSFEEHYGYLPEGFEK